ncbi:hypothetical protein J7L05_01780 [bacterium]|nr:hypothetical protein [bacterium]
MENQNGKKEKRKNTQKNPKTDKKVIKDFERLDAELAKLGVDTKPKYTLSPPLGDSVIPPPINSKSPSGK